MDKTTESEKSAIINGTEGDDVLFGTDGNDTIRGYGGNDVIHSGNGLDVLLAGDGDDTIYGGDDFDHISGDAGADFIDGAGGFDVATYLSSDDAVYIDLANGLTSGGHATGDTLLNIESIHGSLFDDTIYGDDGFNLLLGSGGDDVLFGRGGDDRLAGDAGNDFLDGGTGYDTASFASNVFSEVRIEESEIVGELIVTDLRVDGNGGIDRLQNFEVLSFLDVDIALIAPDAEGDTLNITEDDTLTHTGNLLANDSDENGDDIDIITIDGEAAQKGSFTIAGRYGDLTVDAETGDYDYALSAEGRAALQYLDDGQNALETFTYQISDHLWGRDTAELTIHINGINDAPITGSDSLRVSANEQNVVEGINLLANDTDPEGHQLSVIAPGSYEGDYGVLTVLADGNYKYDLNEESAAVGAIGEGESVYDSFQFTIADERGATSQSDLSVEVFRDEDAGEKAFTSSLFEPAIQIGDADSFGFDLTENSDALTVELF